MKHRWISNPRATYGAYFDRFCRTLDPTDYLQTPAHLPGPTMEPPDDTKTPDHLTGPTMEPIDSQWLSNPQDSVNEYLADTKHQRLSDPLAIYGTSLDVFCASFDPTAPLRLMKGDFAATTKVKEKYRTQMRYFTAPTMVKTCRDRRALLTATYLQGEWYDQGLRKEVYWGHQPPGNKIIPIVIDTGASISISGEQSDFYDGI